MEQISYPHNREANPHYPCNGNICTSISCLFFVEIPQPFISKDKKATKDSHSAFSFRHFILGAVAIFIYVGVEVGIPNIANLFMTTNGEAGGLAIDTTVAGTVVGTYWFLMLCGRLLGGVLGGKISSKTMLSTMTTIGLVFVLLAIILPVDTMVNMPVFKSDISSVLLSTYKYNVFDSMRNLYICNVGQYIQSGNIWIGKYTAAAFWYFHDDGLWRRYTTGNSGWFQILQVSSTAMDCVWRYSIYALFYALSARRMFIKYICGIIVT